LSCYVTLIMTLIRAVIGSKTAFSSNMKVIRLHIKSDPARALAE